MIPPRCKCHTVVPTCSTVYRDPKAVQGTSNTDCGVADGWQPKSPHISTWQGNQPAGGDPESNHSCPGPRDINRDGHNRLKPTLSKSSRAKIQSQPRSSPKWRNGRSRAQRFSPLWGNGRSRAQKNCDFRRFNTLCHNVEGERYHTLYLLVSALTLSVVILLEHL